MDLNTKVSNAVDRAFSKIDSLLKTVAFANKKVTGFDFSTETATSVNTSYSTRGFVESKTKKIDGKITEVLLLMVKTGGIVFSNYTTVTIDSVVYNCSVYESNDFVTTMHLVRTE
jgi:hypothetical protein